MQHPLDSKTIATRLTEYLSARRKSPVTVSNVQQLSDGWESDVYKLTVAGWHVPNEQPMVLRLYFGTRALTSLRRERTALSMIQEDYPAPDWSAFDESPDVLGRPFLLMDYIEGKSLGAIWHAADAAERNTLLTGFCSLLARVHQDEWGKWQHASEKLESYTIAEQVQSLVDLCRHFPLTMLAAADAWLTAYQEQPTPMELVLIHWDFHFQNILVTPSNRWVVIDWTQAQATDPRFDLGWTMILRGSERGWEVAEEIRTGYIAALKARPNKHNLDPELFSPVQMHFFEAFACVKRVAVVIIALKYGAEALGLRPGVEEIIKNYLVPIANVYRHWLELTDVRLKEADELLGPYL